MIAPLFVQVVPAGIQGLVACIELDMHIEDIDHTDALENAEHLRDMHRYCWGVQRAAADGPDNKRPRGAGEDWEDIESPAEFRESVQWQMVQQQQQQ